MGLATALATVGLVLLWIRRDRRSSIPTLSYPPLPERRLAEQVMDEMDLGVLVLNASLSPVYINATARQLLDLAPTTMPVRPASDEVLSIARRAITTSSAVDGDVMLGPRTRARVSARTIEPEGVILFLSDTTDEVEGHQIRRQFVVNASHELKTPVAGIQALAETVNQAIDDDPEAAKRFARKLLIESERLSRLIQDLLDLSRLEDPAHFSDASVDVGAVAEKEAEALRRLAEDRAIALEVDVRRDVFVRGDEQQIGLLVRNLIDNAIRYTPRDGSVKVVVSREGGEGVVEVEDTGAGIPLNAQSRVFERFFRVDEDRSRGSGGTGLGLSIVKHVTEMHGGHVSLRSELGEGSTFKVRLPLLDGESR